MRRVPDKNTITQLLADGLTQKQIGALYGVTPQAVSWALRHQPKRRYLYLPGVVPAHVVAHWRNVWGWSEERIRRHVEQYSRDLKGRL